MSNYSQKQEPNFTLKLMTSGGRHANNKTTVLLPTPGPLLVLIAHDEVLLPRSKRRTQAGRRVVKCLRLLRNVDQRGLEHLLHLHHCCGLQTTIPHLLHSRSDNYRKESGAQWILKHTNLWTPSLNVLLREACQKQTLHEKITLPCIQFVLDVLDDKLFH